MDRQLPGWEAHEQHVNELLGLDSTPASGARWQAPGDGCDNNHPLDTVFPLMIDAKYTASQSYSVSAKFMRQATERAMELGKRFVLPLRFWSRGAPGPEDYIVLGLDDFAELLELARPHPCQCCGAVNLSVGHWPDKKLRDAVEWGAVLCGECAFGTHPSCDCSAEDGR